MIKGLLLPPSPLSPLSPSLSRFPIYGDACAKSKVAQKMDAMMEIQPNLALTFDETPP